MYRLVAFFIVIIILSTTNLVAQEQDEEPLPPRRATSKLGGAGGFTPFWLFYNIDPINQLLKNANAGELPTGGMSLYGGQGYGYIMLLPNVRVGGMGASGKNTASNAQRDVELSIGFGGVTVDYVVPLSSRLDLSMGILLGSGGLDLKITRDDGAKKEWDTLWTHFGSTSPVQNYSEKLSGSFFIYQPSVNLEYALLRWFGVRVGVSYLGMAAGSWKLDDKYDVVNVPDNVSGKGWMINTGVFLGTFMF